MPPSLIKLIRFLAVHPAQSWGFRQLQAHLGVGNASLQRDLKGLAELGVVTRHAGSPHVSYAVAKNSPVWTAITQLIGQLSDPKQLIQDAISGVEGVDAAFIYGSTASGTDTANSDIDLFVLADELDGKSFYRNIAAVTQITGKEISPVKYSKEQVGQRICKRFVREVLSGPKYWVGGDPKQIAPLAVAATALEQEDFNRRKRNVAT